MMKTLVPLLLASILVPATDAVACVGKTLEIGISSSPREQVLAELVSVLVNERTGTKVNVKVFKTSEEVFDAVIVGEVNILIENTGHAKEMLEDKTTQGPKNVYAASKEEYMGTYDLLWLDLLVDLRSQNEELYYAPVVSAEVIRNFPILPRVVNKLGKVVDASALAKMVSKVNSGDKPHKVAWDFLEAKRLI